MANDFDEETSDRAWAEEVDPTLLPGWLQACLPPLRPQWLLKWSEGLGFHVVDEEGVLVAQGDTVSELYKAHNTPSDEIEGHVLLLHESLLGAGQGDFLAGNYMEKAREDSPYGGRFYPTLSDEDRLRLVKTAYKTWREEAYPWWQEDPQKWDRAYAFIQGHPAFWVRREAKPTFEWETSAGFSSLWHGLTHDKEGKPCLMLEHGSHIAPEYTTHYHDLRLDVYAPTFEEGLVEMALLVDKFFHPDGTEREGVEYVKSPLELDLEEAVVSLEAWEKAREVESE